MYKRQDASSEIDIDEHKAKALAENEKAVQAKPAEAEKAPEPVHEIRKEIVSDEEKRRMMQMCIRDRFRSPHILCQRGSCR